MEDPLKIRTAALAMGLLWTLGMAMTASAQDQAQLVIRGGGTRKYALALTDFTAPAGDTQAAGLAATFNSVLSNDLTQSGWVTLVSKSFFTATPPTTPNGLDSPEAQAPWAQQPVSAQRLVSGTLAITSGSLVMRGYLFDLTLPAKPYVTGKVLPDKATEAGARALAHQMADAVVTALGELPFASSHIVWVKRNADGTGDVWMSDYDGYGAHQVTHFGGYIETPRVSPDGQTLSFSGQRVHETHQIHLVSLATGRDLPFVAFKGETGPPSWSPDGTKLVFSSSMEGGGRSKIFTSDTSGRNVKRLTNEPGADDFTPVWNPKTGGQIVFGSDRGSQPHLYLMNADGTGQQALVTDGYAVDPSWSPNGQFIAFAWVQHGGGEDSGAFDIYLWDLNAPPGPQQYRHMTQNGLDNDAPSWGPDGARIVFESGTHTKQLFTVLADGSNPAQLTRQGSNEAASWSAH